MKSEGQAREYFSMDPKLLMLANLLSKLKKLHSVFAVCYLMKNVADMNGIFLYTISRMGLSGINGEIISEIKWA